MPPQDTFTPKKKAPAKKKANGRIAATYPYHDEDGGLLYEAVRYEPKDFKQRRPDGNGGWLWKMKGVRRVPYRLQEINAKPDELLIIQEGEKDVATAEKLGLLATTNAGGAGKWTDELSECIAGRPAAVVIGDHDEAGRKHEKAVAKSLHGRVASVKVVRLFDGPPAEKHGKDFTDWVEDGGDVAQLMAIVAATPEWEPPAAADDDHLEDEIAAEFDAEQDGGADDGGRGPSQSTILVSMADLAGVALYYDDTQKAWARFPRGGHAEVAAVRSKQFKAWLAARFYAENKRTPSSQAINDAVVVLEGKAVHEGSFEQVHVRVAAHDGTIYIDLGDAQWRYIEITATGWRIVDEAPVLFRRPGGMVPLATPITGGSVNELRAMINASDDDWALVLGWLVAALKPTGPYPLLAINGEQGSAKSTTCKSLRRLIDPNKAELRSEPRSVDDLLIAGTNGHVLTLDNLSGVPGWLSDALCRVATGGGLSKRALFTDDDEVIFNVVRPIVANGIEELTTRSDLLDRSLMVTLPTIAEDRRKSEKEYWSEFDRIAPRVLGALLTAVSMALRRIDDVRLEKLPRMADFALWVTAAEPALGLEDGEFMRAYTRNRQDANDLAIEAHPVAKAITAMMDTRGEWEGTATELLVIIEGAVDEATRKQKAWPKAANKLSAAVRRVAPNLRSAGVEVWIGSGGRGKSKARTITLIRKDLQSIVPIVPIVPTAKNAEKNGVEAGTIAGALPSPPGKVSSPPGPAARSGDDRSLFGDDTGTIEASTKTPVKQGVGTIADDGDDRSQPKSNGLTADDSAEWEDV